MVGLASLISIPLGVLSAVFLAELGPNSRLAQVARFATKTLTGLPSILAGVFAYAVVVLTTGTYSAPAGALALAVLMLPTVALTAEEAIKAVPKITRDAAYGMGCTRSQVIWKVLLPTAMPGILTGVMLAVARAAGETAPLLFTALFSSFWLFDGGVPRLMQPTASLAVLIYNFSGMPFENQIELAWAASLVLYEKWILTYRQQHADVQITYEAVGSGEGQRRFLADAVDFGASDAALTDEQIAQVGAVRLVPATAGMVVLAYNLPQLGGSLRIPRDV